MTTTSRFSKVKPIGLFLLTVFAYGLMIYLLIAFSFTDKPHIIYGRF